MAGYGDSYKRGLKFERALPYLKAVNKLGCFASDQTWLKVVPAIYNDIFKTSAEDGDNPELVKAIANMNSNRTKFINQI